MPPKAKPKAKGRVKALAKPKAAMAVVRGRGALRRPALAPPPAAAPGPRELWMSGEEVSMRSVPLELLGRGVKLVVSEGTYFTAPCQVAGTIGRLEIAGEDVHALIRATGTSNENLLRHASDKTKNVLRLHRCGADCSGDRVSEDLVHCKMIRQAKSKEAEEGWVDNLETVETMEDDLKDLRAREAGIGAPLAKEGALDRERGRSLRKKEKKKKARSKKKKKDKKDRGSVHSSPDKGGKSKKKVDAKKEKVGAASTSSSSSSVDLSGRKPRSAAVKGVTALFAGTGLDPSEKVRKRVAKRARRKGRKQKSDKSGSSGRSSSGGSTSEEGEALEAALFNPETKLQKIAELCPGALAAQSPQAMRTGLLQSIGSDDQPGALAPVGLAYFRQQLHRKASGPIQRELINLCTVLDLLVKGVPARAADVVAQRIKSIESTLGGAHWTVSQRLEVCPQDTMTLAAREELSSAQKAAAEEAKISFLASQPEGRSSKGKGKDKDKGSSYRTSQDKGKGKSSNKGDKNKKEEHQGK